MLKRETNGQLEVYRYARVEMFSSSFGIEPVNRFPSKDVQKHPHIKFKKNKNKNKNKNEMLKDLY